MNGAGKLVRLGLFCKMTFCLLSSYNVVSRPSFDSAIGGESFRPVLHSHEAAPFLVQPLGDEADGAFGHRVVILEAVTAAGRFGYAGRRTCPAA